MFMLNSYMAKFSIVSSLKLPFVSWFKSEHFLSCSLYDIDRFYLYAYAFICISHIHYKSSFCKKGI